MCSSITFEHTFVNDDRKEFTSVDSILYMYLDLNSSVSVFNTSPDLKIPHMPGIRTYRCMQFGLLVKNVTIISLSLRLVGNHPGTLLNYYIIVQTLFF